MTLEGRFATCCERKAAVRTVQNAYCPSLLQAWPGAQDELQATFANPLAAPDTVLAHITLVTNAQFRPDEELIARHARWISEIFLGALRSVDARGHSLAPAPPPGYEYPWPGPVPPQGQTDARSSPG